MQLNITEIMTILANNVNAWLPTITSILSVAICIVVGMAKIKRAANDLKSDKTIAELRAEVENDIAENKETRKLERRIINKLLKMYDVGEADDEAGDRRTKRK